MTAVDDAIEAAKIGVETVPLVLALVGAITQVVNAQQDPDAQYDALATAAEAIKKRMDELKFPEESERAARENP